jgi:hypothetical protein
VDIKRRRIPPLAVVYRVARAAIGLGIIGSYGVAAEYLPAPPLLDGLLNAEGYFAWGWGGHMIGFLAGAALFVTCFSSRIILSSMVLFGSILIVSGNLVAHLANQPQFTPGLALWGGLLLAATGFGLLILKKLSGNKF